jgi:hypothetical protein
MCVCTGPPPPEDPSNPAFQYVGRWDLQNPSVPAFQWPGSAVKFQVTCASAANLTAGFETHDAYTKFGVYLNEDFAGGGVRLSNAVMAKGATQVGIGVPSGTSTVMVMKTTEEYAPDPAQGGNMLQHPSTFHGLTDMGAAAAACKIHAAGRPSRRVQVIGDSITCGFGNQLQPKDTASKLECLAAAAAAPVVNPHIAEVMYTLEDTHESYSMQLARRFGAEVHIQCISGIGMCKNAGQETSWHSTNNMTYFVDRTLPYVAPGPANTWDHSRFAPDLLVVNLGTNDYDTSVGPIAPTAEQFQKAYTAFVARAMAHYDKGATKVLLACGPMVNRFCDSVQAVAKAMALGEGQEHAGAEGGYAIAYVSVSLPESPGGCLGCAEHPNQAEDAQMVDLMEPAVRNLTGWVPVA